ncbi:hypothetical protein ACIBHX_40730 [Nonomuraea sp. NPDC050536]|uniref:hypothetical protein n=1 Tax=Nonomuraea sp. NPDC050536 TaxID=3364366 RepID=UPI0037C55829
MGLTERRRRIVMAVSVLLGTLMLAFAAVLVGEAFTGTSLNLIGMPGADSPSVRHSEAAAIESKSGSSPRTPPARRQPAAPPATVRQHTRATPKSDQPQGTVSPRPSATPHPEATSPRPVAAAPIPPGGVTFLPAPVRTVKVRPHRTPSPSPSGTRRPRTPKPTVKQHVQHESDE